VLCNKDTFSNAEIFCHAVKHIKRAPLVGIATAGGVISAIKATIPDVGEIQVPFRGWFEVGTGDNYDVRGAQPDYKVDLTPADEDVGRDPQLSKALEVLAKLPRN
jgi:tricorn protease